MVAMPHPFYGTPQWRKLRAKIKARWKAQGLPCGECGEPIDYRALPIVDHIVPRRDAPERALDPTNLQLVCHGCNTRRAHGISPTTVTQSDGFPEGW